MANYNNYGGFNNNPYNNNNFMQPNYQPQNQYNPYNQNVYQQPIQQQIIFPLTPVNGIEGAKAYLVGLNQCVYLKDNDSNILYEKKADMQGKITLNAFELNSIALDDIGKPKTQLSNKNNVLNVEYVSKSDLKALEDTFNQSMNNLSNDIKNALENKINTIKKPVNNNFNNKNNTNNRK